MVPNRSGPERIRGCAEGPVADFPVRDPAAGDNASMTKTAYRLLATLSVALAITTTTAAAEDFEAGQIWSAKGRAKDPDPQVLILRVETGTPVGDVVFVAAGGLKLCLPNGNCGDMFSPLAITKEALEKSVKALMGRVGPPTTEEERARFQFEKGYEFWKDGVEKGARVTITVPLAEALDEMEGGAKIQVK